ncbi:putative reverse transcriptase domain-containing protein, partial [Tanacetum coccineum]
PKEKEELIIYLAAAKEAISAVLMTERKGKQIPVYFVSRALRGSKINYNPMEKLVLALLSASRRLKRYFQAHAIIVITDQPIKQLLSNARDGGKLGPKWERLYELVESLGKGAYKLKDCKGNELPQTWNIFRGGSRGSFEISFGAAKEGESVCQVDPSKIEAIVKPFTSLPQKNQKYEWGMEQEIGMCAHAKRQGKANVMADALSRKEIVKLKRVRAMSMTIQSSFKDKLLASQYEASKEENAPTKMLSCLDQQMEKKKDGGANKMYYDLRDMYWWPGMKKDITTCVSKCLTCSKVKAEHQRPSGLLQTTIRYLDGKGKITMNFITKLPRPSSGNTVGYEVRLHPSNGCTSEHTIHNLEDMLRACVVDFGGSWDTHLPLAEFSYYNSYHSSIRCATFEVLHGRKCRSSALWTEVGENRLIGLEMVKLLNYEEGDRVFAKVSPLKGAFSSLSVKIPQELNGIHDTFHVSNLNKCLADANLHVPLKEIRVDKTLRFVEELEEIIDREVKKLKRSRISIVKVRWNSKRGPEFTWEHEDFMKAKYLDLFVKRVGGSTS